MSQRQGRPADEVRPAHYFVGTPYHVADVLAAWERMAGGALCHRDLAAIEYIVRSGRKIHPGKSANESKRIDLEKAIRDLQLSIAALGGR